MPYPYFFAGGRDNTSFFETINGIIYDVKFRPSGYLLESKLDSNISNNVFEFIIEIVYKPENLRPPLDKEVSVTVAHIFNDFFIKNNKTICIYFCDSSDSKQEVRMKKFNQWWYQFKALDYVKIEDVLIDSKNNRYPIAMILSRSNPYKMEIIEAFLAIAHEENADK